jgi:hypothetical protein
MGPGERGDSKRRLDAPESPHCVYCGDHTYDLCRKGMISQAMNRSLVTERSRAVTKRNNKRTPSSRICRRWAHLVQASLKNYLLPELSANKKRSFRGELVLGGRYRKSGSISISIEG